MKWSAFAIEQEVDGGREVQLLVNARAEGGEASTRTPLLLTVVLDRSASMTGAPLAAAVDAAEQIIGSCGPDDHVGLVLFDGVVEEAVPVIAVDEAGRRRLLDALRTLGPGRGTSLHQAVRTAASALTRLLMPGRKPSLLVLSDGEPSVGPRSLPAFATLGEEVARMGVNLHAIGLGPHYLPDILAALTRPSGNAFGHADGPEGLPTVMGGVFALLYGEAAPDTAVSVRPLGLKMLELQHTYPSQTDGGWLRVTLGGIAAGHVRHALFVAQPEKPSWSFEIVGIDLERGTRQERPVEVSRTWPESGEGRLLRSIGLELKLLRLETRAWELLLSRRERAREFLEAATACLQKLVILDSPEIDRRRHLDRLADLRLAVEEGVGDPELLSRRTRSAREGTNLSQIIPLEGRRRRRA